MAGNRNEGEGSRTAARKYNKAAREFAETQDVEAKAKAARKALEGDEGGRLRQAERTGKAHAKEEDPAVKRDR